MKCNELNHTIILEEDDPSYKILKQQETELIKKPSFSSIFKNSTPLQELTLSLQNLYPSVIQQLCSTEKMTADLAFDIF